ncbi:MAG: PUA domain-containing protein [Candidatus Nezhaarchaeales archaeon]
MKLKCIVAGLNEEFLARLVKVRADYQFGAGAGEALVSRGLKVETSRRTGKPRYVYDSEGRLLATIRWNDGFLALTIEGARILQKHFKRPKLRVVVKNEIRDFIKRGRSVFAKHVVDVDPEIRCGDEVLVVDEEDNLLAVGRALLSSYEMRAFNSGVAVKVRRGVESERDKPKRTAEDVTCS